MTKWVKVHEETHAKIQTEAKKHKKPGKYTDWIYPTANDVINIWKNKAELYDLTVPIEITGSDKPFTIDLRNFEKLK